jgi:uncharacterized protein YjdB
LNEPRGITLTHTGDILFTERFSNVVRKVNSSGTISTIAGNGTYGYSGDGGPASAASFTLPSAVTEDIHGNVFVLDIGRVRKITPNGLISTFAVVSGASDYMTADKHGNLFVSDWPAYVYKIDPVGNVSVYAGGGPTDSLSDGSPATGIGLFYPTGLATDSQDNLYVADGIHSRIRKIDTNGIITTFAGNGTYSSDGDGGPATNAGIMFPRGIEFDPSGNLIVLEQNYQKIRKISPDGLISTIASNIDAHDLAIGHGGSIFVTTNQFVRKLNNIYILPSDSISTFVPAAVPPGIYHGEIAVVNGTCSTTYPVSVTILGKISGPSIVCMGSNAIYTHSTGGGSWSSRNTSVATIGSSGYLSGITSGTSIITYAVEVNGATRFVEKVITVNGMPSVTLGSSPVVTIGSTIAPLSYTDATNSPKYSIAWNQASQIAGFENTFGSVSNVAGNGLSGYSGDGGPAIEAKLNNPSGVAIDDAGNLYIADRNNYVVRKMSSNGNIITIAGIGTYGYTGDGNAATAAALSIVTGIALGTDGSIYIADQGNNVIRKVNSAGTINTVAGNGSYENSGDGTAATSAGLMSPAAVAVDNYDNVYVVTASETSFVRKITPDGIISTIAGNGIAGYSGDGGPATDASFNGIMGIATDDGGNIFLADNGNNVVRKIDTSGFITTVAGSSSPIYYTDGGPATESWLGSPLGLAAKNGSIYIGETGGSVRKVSPAGIINTIATGGSWTNGLAAASNGEVYFAELYGNVVRKVGTSIILPPSPVSIQVPPTAVIGNYAGSFTVHNGPCLTSYNFNLRVIDTISGVQEICATSSSTFSHTHLGGTWLSSNPAIASVGSSSGLVTGLAAGAATISYIFDGVAATKDVTINPLPYPGHISSEGEVCIGSSVTITSTTPDGVWTSENEEIASIDYYGLITGHSPGTVVISYHVSNGCGDSIANVTVTVNPIPFIDSIAGDRNICPGSNTTLSVDYTGGIWSTENEEIASVTISGIVTGHSAGTTTISYYFANSCGSAESSTIVTVNQLPYTDSITGPTTVNTSSTITLTNSSPSGTWSSSDTSIATVGSTGIVTGIAAGTTTISYTVTNSCGIASATKVVTVNEALTTPIAGTLTVCTGATTALTNATPGGVWSSSAPLTATVNPTTGLVGGVAAGTATISYSLSGGVMSAVVTVNPAPNAGGISGANVVCAGAGITLTSNGNIGGSWSSTNTTAATVSASGAVSGLAAGVTTISYTVNNSCGTASALRTVTVNPQPVAGTISGTDMICAGNGTTLTSNGTAGGVWTSSNTLVATVSASGVASGITGGITGISYTVTNTCGSASAGRTITINPLANAGTITGTATVCPGAVTTLSTDGDGGGTWVSANTAFATVSATGIVTGMAAGSVRISYTVTNGCGTNLSAIIVTVTPLANPGTLSGTMTVCAGANTTLAANGTGGGVWSSTNIASATVNAVNGVVTGINNGNTTISYTVTNGCGSVAATAIVTVSPLPGDPGTITGASSICEGNNITLSTTGSGGVWSSTNTARATVSSGGVVTGIASGTLAILYTVSNSCGSLSATHQLTVNASPAPISGLLVVCPGALTTLTTSPAGGTWSSPHPTVNVNATNGKVTGLTTGTAQVQYLLSTGCSTNTTVTVIPPPGSIGGTLTVCPQASVTLTNGTAGGTWSTLNTDKATIDATTGVATGVNPGVAMITYTTLPGCNATAALTVNNAPQAITGRLAMCPGSSSDLNSTTSGGIWSSGNTAIATVNAVTGIVRSVAGVGTAGITYTVPGLCPRTAIVTVAIPSGNLGTPTICRSQPVSIAILSNPTPGGTWSSSNELVLKISPDSALVKGINTGTAIVTYSLGDGCESTTLVTVTPSVNVISGASAICPGTSTLLVNSTTGGTWSSSNNATASFGTGGNVTGVSAGIATITYMVNPGCYSTRAITVYGSIAPIAGPTVFCAGSVATLTSGPAGGTWSSSNTTTASVTSTTGIVTSKAAGTSTITYKLGSSGCLVTKVITVNATLPAITGTLNVCPGFTTDLDNSAGAGTWSSSNTARATVDVTTGVVTGISGGTSVITYFTTASCYKTTIQSVNAATTAITGADTICAESAKQQTCTPAGGLWVSSNTSVATVSATGNVTGLVSGTSLISYTLSTGCRSVRQITVNALPAPITGTLNVCTQKTTSLNGTPAGGMWTSTNVVKASVDAGSGVVTGLSTGSTIISYTFPTGCSRKATVNVYQSPGAITGSSTITPGVSTVLTCTPTMGVWTSASPSVASIIAASGNVTGINAGVATITYQVSNGCRSMFDINVVAARPDNTIAEEGDRQMSIDIFPNPTQGTITIDATIEGTFAVYTIDGKEVLKVVIEDKSKNLQLPQHLAAGVYMCRFAGNNGYTKTVRLVYQP